MIKVFVSYSWDSEEHIAWVKKLCDDLETLEDIHVIWDGYDLKPGIDKNQFMESSVYEANKVLIVCTKTYKEKANNRSGGVGIETQLNTAKYWDEILENKKNNSIALLKEDNALPRYLNGQVYINFKNKDDYLKSLNELIQNIRNNSKHTRPEKKQEDLVELNLTKIPEIIGLISKNKTCITNSVDGTDFSGSNKIKYELWEISNPTKTHIAALYNNIILHQTFDKISNDFKESNINVKNLIVLRPRDKSKSSTAIKSLLKSNGVEKLDGEIIDTTYKKYLWDYCIDSQFKSAFPPEIIDFYTTQQITNSNGLIADAAVDYLTNKLTNENECTPHLVLGGGGIGKTSLCLSLVSTLIKNHQDKYLTFFIKSEDLRNYLEENSFGRNINEIYDLYEIQARYLELTNIIDKATFELSLLTGNIIIIIDGLDEIAATFKEKFNLRDFLESVNNMRKELGYGRVLITSRNYDFLSDTLFSESHIKTINLLGFSLEHCKKYLNRRFSPYENSETIVQTILNQIEKNNLFQDERIIPFCIDVIATIYEDSMSENQEFVISFESTPYASLNTIIDHIIFSIFNREKRRQKFDLSAQEMIDIFCLLNQELGDSWREQDALENVYSIYESQASPIFEAIKKNPLLTKNEDRLSFKYDFLHSYFNTLSLIQNLNVGSTSNENIRQLSKLTVESSEIKDVYKYFSNSKENHLINFKKIINYCIDKIKADSSLIEKNQLIGAIENLIYIVSKLCNSKKASFVESINFLYSNQINIEHLYFKGDLPPYDFSEKSVRNSKFKKYTKFLECDFQNSSFSSCEFIECHNSTYKNSTFLKAKIEKNTCLLGDLSESVYMLDTSSTEKSQYLYDDIEKFLRSFYKSSTFKDNKKTYIKFSNRFSGLSQKNFQKLISNQYINISARKEIDTFYEISSSFRHSVKRFFASGYEDAKFKNFIKFINTQ